MNKNLSTFHQLVLSTSETGQHFMIGDRKLCGGSWHVKCYDTKNTHEVKDAFLEIYPGYGLQPPQAILHGRGIRKKGIHLRRESFKNRFFFRTTHVPVLFKVPIIEYFIEMDGYTRSGSSKVYPVTYKLADESVRALNIYSPKPLPKGFDAQAICSRYLRGINSHQYLYITDKLTEEEAIADIKEWKRYGGDIGAIEYDPSRQIRMITCDHMHIDRTGQVVCGMAQGKRGYGGKHMDGCIINNYDPFDFCPELPENKEKMEDAVAGFQHYYGKSLISGAFLYGGLDWFGYTFRHEHGEADTGPETVYGHQAAA